LEDAGGNLKVVRSAGCNDVPNAAKRSAGARSHIATKKCDSLTFIRGEV
jgi:hypothetical protein